MNIEPTILYMKDNTGAMRVWAISVRDWVITIEHGQLYGTLQTITEDVEEGKASRSREEQIMSRMASRISKQRDKGYINDVKKANRKAVNALGLLKPMLAQPIKNVKNIDYNLSLVQRKYDGNRCLITCQNGETFAYTRNGKKIDTIDHIIKDLVLEEGMTIDGELYCHGENLQTIVSWIKREQDNTKKLKYHVYDIALNLPYIERLKVINTLVRGDAIKLVESYLIKDYSGLIKAFRGFRDEGYEGAILRWGGLGYEDGKRSKSLVKIKEWEDDEFKIIDIHSSKDGWAILECLAKNGKTFRVSAPGTISDKKDILANTGDYLGKYVTVEYSQLTKDGIPFHPVAIIIGKHS